MAELGPINLKIDDENIRINTHNFAEFGDGFSFCVDSELEAFQAAYIYQHSKRVNVKKAAAGFGWLVQVYRNERPPAAKPPQFGRFVKPSN